MRGRDTLIQAGPAQATDVEMPQAPRRWTRAAGYALGAALAIVLAAVALAVVTLARGSGEGPATVAGAPSTASAWQRTIVSEADLPGRSGVRISQVAVTAGGGLIDLRFQVVDAERADAVHDDAYPPAVVQESSGLVVKDLLMGHSHTEAFHAGQTYYLVFENPGNLVKRGDKVSVLLGDAEVDGVTIK